MCQHICKKLAQQYDCFSTDQSSDCKIASSRLNYNNHNLTECTSPSPVGLQLQLGTSRMHFPGTSIKRHHMACVTPAVAARNVCHVYSKPRLQPTLVVGYLADALAWSSLLAATHLRFMASTAEARPVPAPAQVAKGSDINMEMHRLATCGIVQWLRV